MTAIKDAGVLPKVKAKVKHHKAMAWQDVPAFYTDLQTRSAMAAKALMFTDSYARKSVCPDARHRLKRFTQVV